MSPNNLEEVMRALYQADSAGEAASVFTLVPEATVWQFAQAVLDDPEQGHLVGPALLQGIGQVLETLSNREAALSLLLYALNPLSDSLVYEAAQRTVLAHAQVWKKETNKRLCQRFEEAYLSNLPTGDLFIAIKALEGAVMLPILSGDDFLLYQSIGLLLNQFPTVPDDPSEPAHLAVKSLKLLGRCYDRRPYDITIARKVEQYVGARNLAVDAEARFNLGFIKLYDAFQSADASTFLKRMREAQGLLAAAVQLEENRTDADLFQTIVEIYLALLEMRPAIQVSGLLLKVEDLVYTRRFSFGGTASPQQMLLEFHFAELLTHFEEWVERLDSPEKWPDLTPAVRSLAETYAAFREMEASEGLVGVASRSAVAWVLLPNIAGQFVRLQEITTRLKKLLNDPAWRTTATPYEVELCELVLEEVQSQSIPKDRAVAFLDRIQATAGSDPSGFGESIAELNTGQLEPEAVLEEAIWRRIEKDRQAQRELFYSGPAQKIYDRLVDNLHRILGWKASSREWRDLTQAIALTVHYYTMAYSAPPSGDTSFFFCAPLGLGRDVREKHLEDHFYQVMRWIAYEVRIDKQAEGHVPGRPDLIMHFPYDVKFPIEVKRELSSVDHQHIHDQYLAQAQSYAAGANQVAFLFVLDATARKLGQPLMDILDGVYIDSIVVPSTHTADCVIVMIFSANRPQPSDHSWRKPKGKLPTS